MVGCMYNCSSAHVLASMIELADLKEGNGNGNGDGDGRYAARKKKGGEWR